MEVVNYTLWILINFKWLNDTFADMYKMSFVYAFIAIIIKEMG